MPVDGISADAVLLGNPDWAAPRQKRLLDFLALGMGTDRAVVLMSTLADRGGSFFAVELRLSWFGLFHFAPMR